EPPYKTPIPDKYYLKPNSTVTKASAAIVVLARNSDLTGVVASITQLEAKFNRKFGYPYVFLNDEPFTDEFKRQMAALSSAQVQFGVIPPEHWDQPPWIDADKASAVRERMKKHPNILYGGDSLSYRNMCRFQSGFFFRHELLKPFKYYWRPDVHFSCEIDYDPFLFMQGEDKKYAFTIALPEDKRTIHTLWPSMCFPRIMNLHPELIVRNNAMAMLLDRTGQYYNRCHCTYSPPFASIISYIRILAVWSNFEIADMDLWRSPSYAKFFEFLDSKGGFYYERWGDAPVHTFGAALFLRKDQIHFFNDIGYAHKPFEHCPEGDSHARGKCECNPDRSFDRIGISCLRQYDELFT
ncbi:glycosyltransferase family 15 protein, partial [Mycena epipterygia]